MKLDSPRALKQLNVSGSANISGSLEITGTISASVISGNIELSSTASYVELSNVDGFTDYSSSVDGRIDSLEVESGSIRSALNNFTGSYNTGSFSGSLEGTSSFAASSSFANNTGLLNITATVETTDWVQTAVNGYFIYEAAITATGLLATDSPSVALDLSGVDIEDVVDAADSFQTVYRVSATDDDELTLYASSVPDYNFDLLIQGTR